MAPGAASVSRGGTWCGRGTSGSSRPNGPGPRPFRTEPTPNQAVRWGATPCSAWCDKLEDRRDAPGVSICPVSRPIPPGVRPMSLRSIDLFHVAVPLKKTIRHASHERIDQRQPGRPRHARRRPGRLWRGGAPPVRHRRDDRVDVRDALPVRRGPPLSAGPRDYAEVVRRLESLHSRRPRPTPAAWPATRPVAPWSWPSSTPTADASAESLGQAIHLVEASRGSG